MFIFIILLIYTALNNIFLFNKYYVSSNFYYKLILINKLIKHYRINDSWCVIKYIDLYFSSNFCNFIFIYH